MSSVLELTLPSVEPIALADAKNWLRLPQQVGADDVLIQRLIKAARRHIERCTGLTLAQRNFVQYQDGFPFFPYFQSPYAPLFGAAFPFYFGYGPIASYPYPAIGGLQNQMMNPFEVRALKNPVTAITSVQYIDTNGKQVELVPFQDFVPDFATGRIIPLPGQRWPVSTMGANTVSIFFSAGYAPDQLSAGATTMAGEQSSPGWEPEETIAQYAYLIDPNDNVQMQTVGPSGVTGSKQPMWPTTPGAVTADGTASWTCLTSAPAAEDGDAEGGIAGEYSPETEYVLYNVVIDPNGNLQTCIVENFVSQAGAPPTFATALGATSIDNGETAWRCLGPFQGVMPNPPQQPSSYSKVINLPEDIEMAIYLMLAHFYRNREPVAQGSVSKVPHGVDDLIWAVRDLGFGPMANLTQ
jgi:hypothetical protein